MPLVLAGATSGSTTIQATDAVTQTITLPNATGTVLITNGSGIASVNGIQFPATQSASADANCLDDYEEGTWTPNQGAGLTVVGTFSSSGSYVKIGRVVTVRGLVNGSTSISCSSANPICSNMPFASPNDSAGSFFNASLTAGGVVDVSGAIVYPAGAISSTAGIYFNVTYIIS